MIYNKFSEDSDIVLISVSEDIEKVVTKQSSVALGFFDGVHLGHRKVIEKCVELKKQHGGIARVFTFASQGKLPRRKNGIIQDDEEKTDIFLSLGIDEVISPPFSDFCDRTQEEFVEDILVKKFGAVSLVCGRNYHFGKNGEGDVQKLAELFSKFGGSVHIVEDVDMDGTKLSSTRIRQALSMGDVVFAERALARPFSIEGVVCRGKQLGRQISFPTINVYYPLYRAKILQGVYLTQVQLPDGVRWAITNVGVRPTVSLGDDVLIESHILDYDGDLYDKNVRIYFKNLLRREKKFDTIDELKVQIFRDEQIARKLLSNMGVCVV